MALERACINSVGVCLWVCTRMCVCVRLHDCPFISTVWTHCSICCLTEFHLPSKGQAGPSCLLILKILPLMSEEPAFSHTTIVLIYFLLDCFQPTQRLLLWMLLWDFSVLLRRELQGKALNCEDTQRWDLQTVSGQSLTTSFSLKRFFMVSKFAGHSW